MRSRASFIAAAALAVAGLSACSSGSGTPGGSGTPEPTKAPSSDTANPVPQVDLPKNIKAVTDACQLLKPEQVTRLGGGTPEPDTTITGEPQCAWSNSDFRMNVAINANNGGPANIYEDKASNDSFEPTEVSGYPGALIDRTSSLCRVEVGIAEVQSVDISYAKFGGGSPEMQDTCGYAKRIAVETLKNIPDA